MTVVHKTTKTAEWNAWSGDLDDLKKIAEVLIECVEKRRKGLLEGIEERLQSGDISEIQQESEVGRLDVSWTAEALLVDRDDQATGPVIEVVNQLDRRSATRLNLYASLNPYLFDLTEEVRVRCNARDKFAGLELHVESTDPGWARETFSLLSEEITKGVPKWSWCRSVWAAPLGGWISAVTLGLAILFAIPESAFPIVFDSALPITIGIGSLALIILVQVVVMSRQFIGWMFPPFEITSAGGSPTGTRRIVGLLVVLASVPIGFLVNWITG